jgi:hypothetical protein
MRLVPSVERTVAPDARFARAREPLGRWAAAHCGDPLMVIWLVAGSLLALGHTHRGCSRAAYTLGMLERC